MANENKWVKAITKLNELTQKREISWAIFQPKEFPNFPSGKFPHLSGSPVIEEPSPSGFNISSEGYWTTFKGKNVLIIKSRNPFIANNEISMYLLDENGGILWNFPKEPGIKDLFESVKFQASGADKWVDDLLSDF